MRQLATRITPNLGNHIQKIDQTTVQFSSVHRTEPVNTRCRAPISSWQIGHGQAWQDLGQSWGVKFHLSQDCTRTGGVLLQIERKSHEITGWSHMWVWMWCECHNVWHCFTSSTTMITTQQQHQWQPQHDAQCQWPPTTALLPWPAKKRWWLPTNEVNHPQTTTNTQQNQPPSTTAHKWWPAPMHQHRWLQANVSKLTLLLPLISPVLFTPPPIPTGLQDSSRTPVGLQ